MSYRTVEEYDRERWAETVGKAVRSCAGLLLSRTYGPIAYGDIQAFNVFSLDDEQRPTPPDIVALFNPNEPAEAITDHLVTQLMAKDEYRCFRLRMQMCHAEFRGVPALKIALRPVADFLPPL